MDITFHHNTYTKKRASVLKGRARAYVAHIAHMVKDHEYAHPESALAIASDVKYQKAIKKALQPFSSVKHVILVGIGGSSLGTEAVYDALAFQTGPKLHVIDALNTRTLAECEALIRLTTHAQDLAVVIVSKSGTTTETMTNAVRVLDLLEKQFDAAYAERVVFIGNQGTDFLKIGKKKKITTLALPDVIGGRYSIFSAVGIVPLTLLRIDTTSFLEGAADALTKKYQTKTIDSAVALALYAERGYRTLNFFTFEERLTHCGFWYRQLLAESIGKRMTTKGTTFSHQLLPIVSTGVDLHSMTELYLGGYKHMFTHFVGYDEESPYHVLARHWLLAHMPAVRGRKHYEIKSAIKSGVLHAYDEQKLPYRKTELAECTAYELGLFMASAMLEVMCFAHLCNVDAFTQPSVELYKKHTRMLLTK